MQNKQTTSINCKLNDLHVLHVQIGKKFANIRHSRNEKQINVALATGMSIATLSKIETGHYHRLNTVLLTKLAEYYKTILDVSLLIPGNPIT